MDPITVVMSQALVAQFCEQVANGTLTYLNCEFTIPNLVAYVQYEVSVHAVNGEGFSGANRVVRGTTPSAAPDAPPGLHVVDATTSSITYQWRVPQPRGQTITGYAIMLQGGQTLLLGSTLQQLPLQRVSLVANSDGDLCSDIASQVTASSNVIVPSGTPQTFTVSTLPQSTGYITKVFACNSNGASEIACIAPHYLSASAPSECNATQSVPPHTKGPPDTPNPVNQDENAALDEQRIGTLFIEWTPPYDNEEPITKYRLRVSNYSWDFPANVTSHNVTELGGWPVPAATQFAAVLMAENALGWSQASETSWLTTLPSVPPSPETPGCDYARTTSSTLAIVIQEPATTNGQPILEYQVNVTVGTISPQARENRALYALDPLNPPNGFVINGGEPGDLVLMKYIGANIVDREMQLSNATYALMHQLEPLSEYIVSTRARNALGWSEWSATSSTLSNAQTRCVTHAVPRTPFQWIMLVGGLVLILLVVCCCAICIWRSNLGKMLSPKMRRKLEDADIGEFVSADVTPMEERDPELVLNPIFVHKMQQDKERQRKAKFRKAKGSGIGRTGGFARLGINIDARAKVEEDEKTANMRSVDMYLEKEKGVVDNSKAMTSQERTDARRALVKGQKKHAANSELLGAGSKASGLAEARDHQREANKAAQQVMRSRQEAEDDDDGYGGGGGGIRGGRKDHTAAL